MIAIHLLKLKLELEYSKKLKQYKIYIDLWLNELKLELNNAKKKLKWTETCFSSCNLFQARLTEKKFRPASAFTLFCVEL